MADDRTYIKLFRKMLSWEWYGDTNTFRVFMHILLRANYEPSVYHGVEVPAGACVFGYHSWAEQLGLSVRQTRTAIEHLKSTGEITVKATNKFSVITVANWAFWQIEEGRATNKSTRKATSKRQANDKQDGSQTTTSKESKNNNTISISNIVRPTVEEIRAYVDANNLLVDADYFFRYYETAQWQDIKGKPVRNWKLKALNWSKREEDRRNGNGNHRNAERTATAEEPDAGWERIFGGQIPDSVV